MERSSYRPVSPLRYGFNGRDRKICSEFLEFKNTWIFPATLQHRVRKLRNIVDDNFENSSNGCMDLFGSDFGRFYCYGGVK